MTSVLYAQGVDTESGFVATYPPFVVAYRYRSKGTTVVKALAIVILSPAMSMIGSSTTSLYPIPLFLTSL